jgi:hypothetical protein
VKGQFFLIGAVFVCMLIYAGTAPLIAVQGGQPQDMQMLSDNMASEIPRALNIGINESEPAGTLISFANFSRDASAARGMDVAVVFVTFESTASGTLATAGNAAGDDAIVGIDFGGTYSELSVAAGGVNSTVFAAAGDTFDASVTVGGFTIDATMPGDKTSLVAAVTISRGGAVIRKEILA